ncbi:PLAT domain-containing protein 3-like [Gastrolobium bilobum]|uniref:PLAT domain-containing protein 3-like n=1 Tax=Gastrolobium bilobum TaxID=150636 RepID=UPI002AAF685C|nr:PLAT domain-containing protein 3-like [Gastrolobium bilobum]
MRKRCAGMTSIPEKMKGKEDCVYTVYIQTGSVIDGGTDSIIGLKLYEAYGPYGKYIYIPNLVAWGGVMDPGHNYFEPGNIDIFSGKAPCLRGPVCAMNLSSDVSGLHPRWYCNYVEVTSTGWQKTCAQQRFRVQTWLSADRYPWSITDYCSDVLGQARQRSESSDDARLGSGSGYGFSILGSTIRT